LSDIATEKPRRSKVQLVQLNNKYGSQVYLPYSAGVLQSYVQSDPYVNDNFLFNNFVFIREKLDDMVKKIGDADVLGVSCYVWNWTLSLKLAEKVREKNPNCLIVFGGPQVPNQLKGFFKENNFVDMTVHGEGEVTFLEILKKFDPDDRSALSAIAGTTFHDRSSSKCTRGESRDRIKDLNTIPSPYLTGVFDGLLQTKDYSWMVTWETNRGCPFKCTFCDWGSAVATKVRKFSDERLLAEIDYFSSKEVDLIFGADANFGIFPRDKDYALRLAEKKKETGYPNQFRVCFTKNSTDKVFELARIFSDAGMNKGVSISMQSLNETTLESIKRKNIKMKFFNDLQKKYVANGLVTYTELILPLPGETYESFVEGVDTLLDNSQHSGIVMYNCSIMPNAEMGEEKYQKEHGLDLIKIPIFQAHSDKKDDEEVTETETIVIGTNTMNRDSYKETYKFAWAIQSMHLLGLLQIVAIVFRYHFGVKYCDFYKAIVKYGEDNPDTTLGKELCYVDNLIDGVFTGGGYDQYVPGFEDISWPPEEASYLRVSENLDTFYEEIKSHIMNEYTFYKDDEKLISDIITYQKMRVVSFKPPSSTSFTTSHNIHQFFEEARSGQLANLVECQSTITVDSSKIYDDKKLFSREVVWYGRKGGKFFRTASEDIT
tara:strand:+ start:1262 stop:3235 length:1974 start_codon:yes stop_codon:yes gene_type:complete